MIEYYQTVKRNDALVHATTRMNSERLMISGRSQSQRTSYVMIPSM